MKIKQKNATLQQKALLQRSALFLIFSIIYVFLISFATDQYLDQRSNNITKICNEDIKKYCPINLAPQGRYGNCLYQQYEFLTPNCRFHLEDNSLKRTFFASLLAIPTQYAKALILFGFSALIFISINYFKEKSKIDFKNLSQDINYFIFNDTVTKTAVMLSSLATIHLFFEINSMNSLKYYKFMTSLIPKNFILELITYLLIMDFLGYLAHRLQHSKFLWKYHAIHHSSQNLEWHSNFRFHPIDTFIQSFIINLIMALLGFKFLQLALVLQFKILFDCFVHSKNNIDFGLLKYILVSPKFHRKHHELLTSKEKPVNYAGLFSFWDIFFLSSNFQKDRNSFGITE